MKRDEILKGVPNKRARKILHWRDRIIEEFDFDSVHDVMDKCDWCWGDGTKSEVPSVKRIRLTAHYLFETLISEWLKKHNKITISTGGLKASITKKGRLSLYFAIDDVTSYEIDEMDKVHRKYNDDNDEETSYNNDYEDDYVIDETEE